MLDLKLFHYFSGFKFYKVVVSCHDIEDLKGALPPETEARNRKLTVFAMSLYFFFCVLWAYFAVTDGMSTNKGLQQAKFEE